MIALRPRHGIQPTVARGDTITLPRGTAYQYRGNTRRLGRALTVTVHSVSPGWVNTHEASEGFGFVHLPGFTWVGSGGYWSDVLLTPELCAQIGVPAPVIDPLWANEDGLDVIPSFGPGYDNRPAVAL